MAELSTMQILLRAALMHGLFSLYSFLGMLFFCQNKYKNYLAILILTITKRKKKSARSYTLLTYYKVNHLIKTHSDHHISFEN